MKARALATSPALSVVILNWNAADDTVACVQRLLTWRRIHPSIWVVDNASHGDDVAQIKQACPAVHMIQNVHNLGFAGGTNRGLRAALDASDAPILLLNNDAQVDEDAIQALLHILHNDSSVGIAGPLLYDGDRLITAGNRNPVLHLMNLIPAPLDAEVLYTVDYISGSVALIRADLLRTDISHPDIPDGIGLLDEAYFFTGEVADFCRRAREQGFKTVIAPNVRANHHLARSSALRGTLYTYYIVRNRFRYVRKFYRWLAPILIMSWGLYGLLITIQLRLKNNPDAARAIWMGTRDGIRGRFGGQNERVLMACGHALQRNTQHATRNPAAPL